MTESGMTDALVDAMKGLSTVLAETDYTTAINTMKYETGWTFPITMNFKLFWADQRCRRHLFFALLTQQAHKFRVGEIHLHQRFDHYKTIVDKMDKDFELAKQENPELFLDASSFADLSSGQKAMIFGTYSSSGFASDDFGNDTTYTNENEVQISPLSTDT